MRGVIMWKIGDKKYESDVKVNSGLWLDRYYDLTILYLLGKRMWYLFDFERVDIIWFKKRDGKW